MNNERSGAIKGLSIANLVLSICAIVAVVIGLIAFGVFGATFASVSGEAFQYYAPSIMDSLYELYEETGIYMTPADLAHILFGTVAVGGILLVFALILCIVMLVASIIGFRNYNRREKYGQIMGWSIAGAIVSFFTGSVISMVLFIIVAVFAFKGKHEPVMYQQYQQPAYTQPNPSPSQPYGTPAPQAYTTPQVQPTATTQPTADTQPTQPQVSVPELPDAAQSEAPVPEAETEPSVVVDEEVVETDEEIPTPAIEEPPIEVTEMIVEETDVTAPVDVEVETPAVEATEALTNETGEDGKL